jgi:hypothetical protein
LFKNLKRYGIFFEESVSFETPKAFWKGLFFGESMLFETPNLPVP